MNIHLFLLFLSLFLGFSQKGHAAHDFKWKVSLPASPCNYAHNHNKALAEVLLQNKINIPIILHIWLQQSEEIYQEVVSLIIAIQNNQNLNNNIDKQKNALKTKLQKRKKLKISSLSQELPEHYTLAEALIRWIAEEKKLIKEALCSLGVKQNNESEDD